MWVGTLKLYNKNIRSLVYGRNDGTIQHKTYSHLFVDGNVEILQKKFRPLQKSARVVLKSNFCAYLIVKKSRK